jgi:hypothetical protein
MARPDDDEFIEVSEEIAEGEEGKGYGRADGPEMRRAARVTRTSIRATSASTMTVRWEHRRSASR